MITEIVNQSKNVVIVGEAYACNTFFQRMFGLLTRKELKQNSGILLFPCLSIHTWFMRFPIDVIFIDRKGTVTTCYQNVKPYKIKFGGIKAYYAIELRAGVLLKSGTKPGDQLVFKPEIKP